MVVMMTWANTTWPLVDDISAMITQSILLFWHFYAVAGIPTCHKMLAFWLFINVLHKVSQQNLLYLFENHPHGNFEVKSNFGPSLITAELQIL